MKAVVLAGGYATRLWPITKHRAKMFLPVGDELIIDRIFAYLETDDRIETVYLSTNERFAEDFKSYFASRDFEKPRLSIEQTSEENEKFGVIGSLAQLVEREGIRDDLFVIAGDNLISFDIEHFLNVFDRTRKPLIAAYDVGSRERAKSYGVVKLDGKQVVDFQEKPDDPQGTHISTACYTFPAESLLFDEYLSGGNNPDEPGWFIQWLLDRRPIHAFTFEGAWFDIGTPQSYLDAVEWILDGENLIEDSVTLESTTLDKNVHIMAGAEVIDTHLSNAVVFPDATVVDCDLQNSIIDGGTHIKNLNDRETLVGAPVIQDRPILDNFRENKSIT